MATTVRRGVRKKPLTERDIRITGAKLRRKEAVAPYARASKVWEGDLGWRLSNFRRLHATLRRFFPGKSLARKHIAQMGAGNGVYMHFLAEEYGVRPTTIELSRRNVLRARKEGIKANHIIADARKTRMLSGSQDMVLSDHFLFSRYFSPVQEQDVAESRKALKEAFRILKPGGLMIIERASPAKGNGTHNHGLLDRPYLDREHLEGFEVVEHVTGLHDYADDVIHVARGGFGFSGLDLHPFTDLVVLRKPVESKERKFFTPLDMFK